VPAHVAAAGPTLAFSTRDFPDLFEFYVNRLVGRFGCPREEAEDAVQFAFVQLIEREDLRGNIEGWLWTVAKHEVCHSFKRPFCESLEQEGGDEWMPRVPDAASVVEQAELLELVSELKPQQEICLLLFGFGFSYREICERTGRTYTWVNRHLTEGRAALRRAGT
jgi:DNA-directed RNA polymerase specialized sigma24 family protein